MTVKWPVLHAGGVPDGRPRDLDAPRVRRGRGGGRRSTGSSSTRCRARATSRTSTASRAGAASTRRSRASTGASSRSSAGRCRRARFAVAWAEHDFTANVPLASLEDDLGAPRHPRRRRAAHARPRLPAAPRRPAQVLLEERQVAPRDRAAPERPARLLGALRLQQRRRPLAGGALRLLIGRARSLDRGTSGPSHADELLDATQPVRMTRRAGHIPAGSSAFNEATRPVADLARAKPKLRTRSYSRSPPAASRSSGAG